MALFFDVIMDIKCMDKNCTRSSSGLSGDIFVGYFLDLFRLVAFVLSVMAFVFFFSVINLDFGYKNSINQNTPRFHLFPQVFGVQHLPK